VGEAFMSKRKESQRGENHKIGGSAP